MLVFGNLELGKSNSGAIGTVSSTYLMLWKRVDEETEWGERPFVTAQ